MAKPSRASARLRSHLFEPRASARQVDRHLPLKPLVFQVLLALSDGERHGWSLVREVQQRGGFGRIMPGNFYRTLRSMLADGFIDESTNRPEPEDDDERRRYFAITARGERVAAAEARRLEAAVAEARSKRLLTKRG
jgi:DNA-binding PadR family transcriptional regulator